MPAEGVAEGLATSAGRRKNLLDPDEHVEQPGFVEDYVEIGGYTVGRTVQQPGWRWSKDVRATGDGMCEAHHVGVVLSGRWGAELRDGTVLEWGPDDVFDCPAGHDGYTIGDEPCVMIEWAGVRTFLAAQAPLNERVLATILFTDLVGSTETAVRLGDVVWQDVLGSHYHTATEQIERFGGNVAGTTGDGVVAIFDAPVRAIRCAVGIRDVARAHGLEIRAGVHVGEVDLVPDGVRGAAVHAAARVLGVAEPGQVVVTDLVRTLASATGLTFEDLGAHEMKGFEEPARLFALVG